MYRLDDTIVAVSSPACEQRVIVRISGPNARAAVNRIFTPRIMSGQASGIIRGSAAVDEELTIDGMLYWFAGPNSYTAEDVAEVHLWVNSAVTESLMSRLLGFKEQSVRMAGPGEFTVRAYLNGKMDLAQAEAVGEIVASSNRFQLAAAEKLLAGRLGQTGSQLREELMDLMSLIEAGLDFSQEDVEFITRDEAAGRLRVIKQRLNELLSGSISYESVIDMPSVGIAGPPNAGKSSLLNALLGKDRSIVSEHMKTTRDVLTGILELEHCRCVVFDCAGLIHSPEDILDELSQQAAIEAIRNSAAVVFCVDVSKAQHEDEAATRKLIESNVLIAVATKCDLLSDEELSERPLELRGLFGLDFLATSAKTGTGLESLRRAIDSKVVELSLGSGGASGFADSRQPAVALTARHQQAAVEAMEHIAQAILEVEAGNDEVAAMLLRAAHQALSTIEQQPVDEQILQRIFSRFCIGK